MPRKRNKEEEEEFEEEEEVEEEEEGEDEEGYTEDELQDMAEQSTMQEENPYNVDQAPAMYANHEMLYQKYLLYLNGQIKQAPWTKSFKDNMMILAAQPAFPDMVLANLDDRSINHIRSRYRIALIKAGVAGTVPDKLTDRYVIINEVLKNHIEFPLSRTKGKERERIAQIRRIMTQESEQSFVDHRGQGGGKKKGSGLLDKLSGMFGG
jgi:hypothetical protein